MDPDESPFSRFGRTLWAALAYITTSVVRFLRTETDTTGENDPSSHEEDDVTRETAVQKCKPEHPERGARETEVAVGAPDTDVHSRLRKIPWEKCEVIEDHHEKETNVYSVQYSKVRRRKTELDNEKLDQESFGERDEPKQDIAAQDGDKQTQDSSVRGDHRRDLMDITVSHTEHRNDHMHEADTLIKKLDDTMETRLNTLDMGEDSAERNSGIVGDSVSGFSVHGVRDQEERMIVQGVDHGNDPDAEAPQSRAIHTEQDKAALSITLMEQTQPEPYACHTEQDEAVPDATHNDQDTPQSTTTFIDQEEEIHILTHRLVEAVVMSSVEFVNNELKIQEGHEEDHAQISKTNLTYADQVDGAHDLTQYQQPISNRPVEPMTVWYDGETEGGTELAENEKHEGEKEEEEQEKEERLVGERPEACVHDEQPWQKTEESEEEQGDETESQESSECMEDQITENKVSKAQDLAEIGEQEVFSNTDQNRHEEEDRSQLQAAEDHISDKQLCEKEEHVEKEEVAVFEPDSDDDTTVQTKDEICLHEEVMEHSCEEDYGDEQIEKQSSIEGAEAEVMAQYSPLTAETPPLTDMAQATSDVIEEDLPLVGQYPQEMNTNTEEMIDGAIEVTDTSQDAGAEEAVGQKAEPRMEERMEDGEDEEEKDTAEEEEEEDEEEEEERDEFEGLRPAEESEDEGVSIDPEDTEVQEAHEGWHSEEGETDFTDGFTSPITEASDALLYEAEIPESELIETGTDASLLREDEELTTTEAEVGLTSRLKDAEPDMQWESQMASQESEIAAASGYTESEHTPAIFSAIGNDGAMADSELVENTPWIVLKQDVPEEMIIQTLDSDSDTERGLLKHLSETSESKPRQQEEAEVRIKRQLSNEPKSLDESGSELEMKRLTTTILTDVSDQEESTESDIKPTADITMGSELVDMPTQSCKKLITLAEEHVEELEIREAAEASTITDPEREEGINPLQSRSGSEDVARTSQWDAFEEHEDDNIDSSKWTESVKGASQKGGCVTETPSTQEILLIETDSESNFPWSETAEAVLEKSLQPIQMMSTDEETVEAPQTQADPDILSPNHQTPRQPPEAESGESQEPEREYGEETVEDSSKTQQQELSETGSMSSDEDREDRETQEESNAAGSNLMWEATGSKMAENERGSECRSVMETLTDMNEKEEDETDGITEKNTDNLEELVQKALEEDVGEEHDEADAEKMAAMQVESEETSSIDGRMLKRKLGHAIADDEEDPAGGHTPQVSSLDFSIQKSRIAVKNPQVRPPKDPRTLLNMPSLEPTPRPAPEQESLPGQPDKKLPAFGVPLGGVGVMGVKLPGLGAGFPVLRKTNRGPKEEEKSESSSAQEQSETEKTQTEDAAEEVQTQSKPKWTPPKHAIGMGNPFMMAELKGKLKKPGKE